MTTEYNMDSLLDNYAFAVRSYALAPDAEAAARMDATRALLLSHLDAAYVRRYTPGTPHRRWSNLPPHVRMPELYEDAGDGTSRPIAGRDATRPPASPPGSYKAARGILPWRPGDELPEERIRRLRDDDCQHTLHLDDAGQVAGGAPDFEGER